MKKILLTLVLVVGLFSTENKNNILPIMKHETKIQNGIGTSKFIINSEKIGLNQHKFNAQGSLKYDSNYILNISASIDNVSVFNAILSPYISSKGYFKFKFKDFTDSDDIRFSITDNHGKSREQFLKIKRENISKNKRLSNKKNDVKLIIVNPKAWDTITVDSAIEAVYGLAEINRSKTYFNKENIEYPSNTVFGDGNCLSDICPIDNFYALQVSIQSEIDLESIAIFSTTTPKPLLAFIQISNNVIAQIMLPFRVQNTGEVFFVGKAKDKKLYRSKSNNIEIILHDSFDHASKIYFNIK